MSPHHPSLPMCYRNSVVKYQKHTTNLYCSVVLSIYLFFIFISLAKKKKGQIFTWEEFGTVSKAWFTETVQVTVST